MPPEAHAFEGPWPDYYPSDVPPPDAVPAAGRVYRIVKAVPPTKADFSSGYEDYYPKEWGLRLWMACGTSFFTNLDDARSARDESPRLRGRRIVVGDLRPEHGVMKSTPNRKRKSHITVWLRTTVTAHVDFTTDAEVP